jgi:hypothetical protein
MDADTVHQEQQDSMSDFEKEVHHEILEGAPKAVFFYVEDYKEPNVGWVVMDGTYFAWKWDNVEGYSTFSLKQLGAGDDTQHICTGCGQVPIGYAVLEEK